MVSKQLATSWQRPNAESLLQRDVQQYRLMQQGRACHQQIFIITT